METDAEQMTLIHKKQCHAASHFSLDFDDIWLLIDQDFRSQPTDRRNSRVSGKSAEFGNFVSSQCCQKYSLKYFLP